jgi:hypothetical protein
MVMWEPVYMPDIREALTYDGVGLLFTSLGVKVITQLVQLEVVVAAGLLFRAVGVCLL